MKTRKRFYYLLAAIGALLLVFALIAWSIGIVTDSTRTYNWNVFIVACYGLMFLIPITYS